MYDFEYKNTDLWSLDDISLYVVKYLSYPKDFDTISTFFYNKTTRDIINFYHNFREIFDLRKHTEKVYEPTAFKQQGWSWRK